MSGASTLSRGGGLCDAMVVVICDDDCGVAATLGPDEAVRDLRITVCDAIPKSTLARNRHCSVRYVHIGISAGPQSHSVIQCVSVSATTLLDNLTAAGYDANSIKRPSWRFDYHFK